MLVKFTLAAGERNIPVHCECADNKEINKQSTVLSASDDTFSARMLYSVKTWHNYCTIEL